MKKNNRWMKWIIGESAKSDVQLPWSRGNEGKSRKKRCAARLVPPMRASA